MRNTAQLLAEIMLKNLYKVSNSMDLFIKKSCSTNKTKKQ